MNTSTLIQKVWNFCHTLRAAFSGQRALQDPADEPASVLLERIRAERAKVAPSSARRGRRQALSGV